MKLSVKKSIRTALLGTAAASMVFAGTGIASAAHPVTIHGPGSAVAVPASDIDPYMMCGVAYIGADNHVGPPPANARAVEGVHVTGKLMPAGAPIYTDITNEKGQYCFAGDAAMAAAVAGGASVNVTFTSAPVSDSTGTYTGNMSGGGTDATIDALEFFLHGNKFPLPTSDRANHINIVFKL